MANLLECEKEDLNQKNKVFIDENENLKFELHKI